MRITMKDIAAEAGVSITTVSHVINGTKKLSPQTVAKIQKIIDKYNYMPNHSAKSLRKSKSKVAGLIVSSFPDTYVTRYINSISIRAKEMGYSLLFVNTNEDATYEEDTLKLFNSQMVDGVIISPAIRTNKKPTTEVEGILNTLPIVLISRYHDSYESCPHVVQDDFQAGYDTATHFIYHGHKNMGIIYSTPHISATDNRIEGFKRALKDNNFHLPDKSIFQGYATEDGGSSAIKELLAKNKDITAVFILNDTMTVGVIDTLREMNVSIPNDLAIIGFGDFPAAKLINPSITTINSSPEALGQTAFDMLLSKINNKDYYNSVKIPTYLIRRRSCGCDD